MMKKLQLYLLCILCTLQITCTNHCSKSDGVDCTDEDDQRSIYGITELARRDPGEVGDVVEEDLGDGTTQTVITRATDPPLFELPDFLSEEECDHIIELAKKKGMKKANVVVRGGIGVKNGTRQSESTFLPGKRHKILKKIMKKASLLTGLPKELVYDTEKFQVGHYGVGGFYGFHFDTSGVPSDALCEKPCCHQIEEDSAPERCAVCRYVTILMYLNDVEEGGETAFPLADKPDVSLHSNNAAFKKFCEDAPVLVSPVKGNAVMWYNARLEHGWLGLRAQTSYHGGCPVIKGEKWISNLWINAPNYKTKHIKSIYS